MLDRAARAESVRLLTEFLSGERTGFALEGSWPSSDDAAVEAVSQMVWYLYDDLEDGPLVPTPASVDLLERCIDFLETDESYGWPIPNRWLVLASIPLAVLTFGLANRLLWRRYAFPNYWPFESQLAREAARRRSRGTTRPGLR